MSLVSLSGVGAFLGGQRIFTDVSFDVSDGDKIGLVGRNGTGKTTLLRLIAGEIEPETGRILRAKGVKIGFLRQEVNGAVVTGVRATNAGTLRNEKTASEEQTAKEHTQEEHAHEEHGAGVLAFALEAFADVFALRREIESLEKSMARPDVFGDGERLHKTLARYDELSQEFERRDGYNLEVKARTVLFGLGFGEDQLGQNPDTLSGGQKVRLGLARLLLEEPDLLLLDEPTNHLDLEATQWLEGFLAAYKRAFILVSHDRYFLDAVTRRTLELEDSRLTVYQGNYTAYVNQKRAKSEHQEKLYRRQQEEIARAQAFINKFRAGTRATMVKSREKYLARLERIDRPKTDGTRANFALRSSHSSSRVAIALEGVSKSYGEKTVFADVDLELERGTRLGVVGPNGSGKTTLARLVAGREEPTAGSVRRGEDVKVGYFTQDLADLTPGNTVLEELLTVKNIPIGEARSLLARFLFRGEDVFKSVNVLSGGERNRLHLAKLLLAAPSLLVLDEPTNHLDIAAREALEEALRAFDGTLVVISHDRYLLDHTVNLIAEVDRCRVRLFEGNYSAYWAARTAIEAEENVAPKAREDRGTEQARRAGAVAVKSGVSRQNPRAEKVTDSTGSKPKTGARRDAPKEVSRIEEEIAKLEEELAQLNELLADPGLYAADGGARVRELVMRQRELLELIEQRYETWERSAAPGG